MAIHNRIESMHTVKKSTEKTPGRNKDSAGGTNPPLINTSAGRNQVHQLRLCED